MVDGGTAQTVESDAAEDGAPAPAIGSASPSPGDVIDQFRLLRELGRGGMGEVYLARDTRLGRRVALKVIRKETLGKPDAVARFLNEARITASFNHAHIVTVYAVGDYRGSPYVALEYLEGPTLRERLTAEAPTRREALRFGLAIAEAVAEAHAHGVLHRDLKPENVMVPLDGRLRVLDFGLAKSATASLALAETADQGDGNLPVGDALVSRGGQVVGTPLYMSPEQWAGEVATPATDVWAIGLILYELVGSGHPYGDLSLYALGARVASTEPPPAISVPGLPPTLTTLIPRCLARSPDARPSALDIVGAIRAALDAGPKLALDECPFRGLLPYTEAETDRFFGREPELVAFLERLRIEPVMPVIGPSGAGKARSHARG